jgi:hypothetical protein
MDDLSFDFGAWFMANHEELTEDHIERFLDHTYGTFDWSSYHMHENDYLTHQDISDHME